MEEQARTLVRGKDTRIQAKQQNANVRVVGVANVNFVVNAIALGLAWAGLVCPILRKPVAWIFIL